MAKAFEFDEKLLERCSERAAVYDRENRFCQEDFDELKEAGWLLAAVPEEFGGYGMNLAQVGNLTRQLAYYAPATALCMNMHHYWIGLIADLSRSGDKSLDWALEDAGNGEVFAAGHAESGNDLPLLLSTTKAEPVDGGYKFTGRKSFGSLTPVWTRMGMHGMDTSDPDNPKIVHVFMTRDSDNFEIKETWDVMGMRATRSDDTILDGVFIPQERVARVVPVGAAGIDQFVLGIFAWALVNFGYVYSAMAQRALDITIQSVQNKPTIAIPAGMSHHPGVQQGVAAMTMMIESIAPQLDKVAQDWSDGVDYGPAWGVKIIAAKYNAVETAWKIVDQAMEISGGFGMFKKSELERLFRDARAGRFHPANSLLAHEFIGKGMLGINPDDAPRWG
ncbi:MAG: acyl-CoA dehydrogenase family protein [Acidobacteriota bacterium]|jgi:alkylation response protein AidB-like acyl-CoA dehydrogenase